MKPTSSRDEEVFADALARPAQERPAFLARVCGNDAAMLARIAALIAAHEGPESLLAFAPETRPAVTAEEKPGDAIGRYKLLQKIGEGGCGVVWMAEQEEPVRRRVALKVIKLGMDTKAVVARFEAERQALAMMDHPNIAKVHDAGATDTGRPFFVMELVRGIPITKYCDENHLTPKDRLELFIKVCQAVQHAHQKGIIHRDLKPSNILVTVNDGSPTPKIIDFGIAKATQGKLTDATVFTAFEQFIGTPVYMSPEQAEMSSLDIDTRSDIYSLGVLLYELLTGRPPFDPKNFAQAGVDQIRQQIREVEPPRPSTRLSTLDADERTTIAKLRGTAASNLSIILRGDLDWIVMRCIEKDRTRRYDTANGLAMDIERYLRHEPVIARPPSTGYLLSKLIRRHRVGFAAGAGVAVVIIVGAAVSMWQAVRAARAEREQIQLREAAQQAQASEAQSRRTAEIEALAARQRAYASDMNLVQQALAVANLGRARELLYRHRPQHGQRDLRDWEWRYLWQFCQSDAQTVFCEKPSSITSLAASPDGKWLAVAEQLKGGLSLWNLRTKEEIRLPAGDGRVTIAFSPSESLLAIATSSTGATPRYRVLLWDATTRRTVNEITVGHEIRRLVFSGDGKSLVTSGQDPNGPIEVWQVDGKKLASYATPEAWASIWNSMAATSDFSVAAYAAKGGRVRLIDLGTGRERWAAKGANEFVVAVAFSPDEKILATSTGYFESDILLWEVASGRQIGRLEGHRSYVHAFVFWPDGKTLASASADQTILIWDVGERRLLNTLRGHKLEIWSLALLPDQETLVSGSKDGSVYLWDTTKTRLSAGGVTLPKQLAAWRFAADSGSVLTVDWEGHIERWKGELFVERSTLMNTGRIAPASEVEIAADCPLVAVGSSSGQIVVWDWERRAQVQRITIAETIARPIRFLRRGRRLLLSGGTPSSIDRLREWDLNSGKETRSWALASNAWSVCGFSPDEQRCQTIDVDGMSTLIDLVTGRMMPSRLNVQPTGVPTFSPDGRLLAAASIPGIVRLWDATTFREVATLSGFMLGVHSVGFSPNGQRLGVGSTGSEAVRLWDVESHQNLLTLPSKGSAYRQTAFSPDGNLVGSISRLGALTVWRAPSWQEIEAAEKAQAAKSGTP